MAKQLRLGYTMSVEQTDEFTKIDGSYVVNSQQINLVKEAKKSCRTHPIKF
jgi:hypothetical protein